MRKETHFTAEDPAATLEWGRRRGGEQSQPLTPAIGYRNAVNRAQSLKVRREASVVSGLPRDPTWRYVLLVVG